MAQSECYFQVKIKRNNSAINTVITAMMGQQHPGLCLEEDIGGPDDEEVEAVRPLRAPGAPTKEEIDTHMASHTPYCSWCRHCVAGRGRSDAHRRVDHSEDAVPTISFDYAFFGEEAGVAPLLVSKDSSHRWLDAAVVPCKGAAHPWPVKVATSWAERSGHPRVILK